MPWSHSRLRRWPKAGHPSSTGSTPGAPSTALRLLVLQRCPHHRHSPLFTLDRSFVTASTNHSEITTEKSDNWTLTWIIYVKKSENSFGWTGKKVPSVCFWELIVNNRWNIQQSLLCRTLSFLRQEIEDSDNHLKDWRRNKRNSRVLLRRIFVIQNFG